MFLFDALLRGKSRPSVMGILNVTPDSFSDGGTAFSLENVKSKVDMLCSQGADIIDVGACSTAPGNHLVSEEEEINRLKQFLPVVIQLSTVPVSVDTFRPKVAEYALSQGASVINDESGCFKEEMAKLVKEYSCGWIFMHTGNKSSSQVQEYKYGVTQDVLSFFSDMRKKAISFGIDETQLAFDCGIGFGKSREDDLELLSNCDVLSEKFNLLVGVSRKRIIGELTGESEPLKRVKGSVAVAKLLAEDGVKILRVHDVKETLNII